MSIHDVVQSKRPLEALASLLDDVSYTAADLGKNSLTILFQHLKKDDFIRQYSDENITDISTLLQLVQRFAGNPENVVVTLANSFIVEMINIMLGTLYALRENENELFSKLYEEILETISIISESSVQAKGIIIESFCDRLLQVVTSSTFKFTTKMETLKAINALLEKCPVVVREKMGQSKTHTELMYKLGRSVVKAGDYELQVGMVEALFRMTHRKDREKMARIWFEDHIHLQAFQEVKDTDFETDCRQFLNIVNNSIAGKPSVWSYPCQYAKLGRVELHKPLDENYADFWVDFNTSSRRVSLFCQGLEEEESLWETVTLWEDNIKEYLLKVKGETTHVTLLLDVDASDLTTIHSRHLGNEVRFGFSSNFDILTAIKSTLPNTTQKQTSKVKVSSGARSIQVINGQCDVTEIRSSQDNVSSTPRQRKVSVPCVPMSTCTNYMPMKSPNARALEGKSGTVARQGETPSMKCITVQRYTAACEHPKTPKTPKTPNNGVKPKRKKTPLQLVSGNGSTPAKTKDAGCGMGDAINMKVSTVCKAIPCFQAPEEVSDKDTVVPSSVPEEPSFVSASQELSQTFPVLAKRLRANEEENVDIPKQMDPVVRCAKGVAVTPCLSTITEESGQTSIKFGSVKSAEYPASSGHSSRQTMDLPVDKFTPSGSPKPHGQTEPFDQRVSSKKATHTDLKSTSIDLQNSGNSTKSRSRSRTSRKECNQSQKVHADLKNMQNENESQESKISKCSLRNINSNQIEICPESERNQIYSKEGSHSTRRQSSKGKPVTKQTQATTPNKDFVPRTTRSRSRKNTKSYNEEQETEQPDFHCKESNYRRTPSESAYSPKYTETSEEKDFTEPDPQTVKTGGHAKVTHQKAKAAQDAEKLQPKTVKPRRNFKADDNVTNMSQDLIGSDQVPENEVVKRRNPQRQNRQTRKQQSKTNASQNEEQVCKDLERESDIGPSLEPSLICIKETQLSRTYPDATIPSTFSSEGSDVQCGQLSKNEALLFGPKDDRFDSQLVDSGFTAKLPIEKICNNQSAVQQLTAKSQTQKQKPKSKFFKSRNRETQPSTPVDVQDLYEFRSDDEIAIVGEHYSKQEELCECSPKQTTKTLAQKKKPIVTKTVPPKDAHNDKQESDVYFSDVEKYELKPGKKTSKKRTHRKKSLKTQPKESPDLVISQSPKSQHLEFGFSDIEDHELITEKTPVVKCARKKMGKLNSPNLANPVNGEGSDLSGQGLTPEKVTKSDPSKKRTQKAFSSSRRKSLTFTDLNKQEVIPRKVTYSDEMRIPKTAHQLVGVDRTDASGSAPVRSSKHKLGPKVHDHGFAISKDIARIDSENAESQENQLASSPEVPSDNEKKTKMDKKPHKKRIAKPQRKALVETSVQSAENVSKDNSKRQNLDRKMNALEKSLSMKFGFTTSQFETENLPESQTQGFDEEVHPAVKTSKHKAEASQREKQPLKRKREENPYDSKTASEKHLAKRSRKHRSIFSETEESRSEISWLASTCKRKEKQRRIVKTYAVKKTEYTNSQQFDMSTYDFDCDSDDEPMQKTLHQKICTQTPNQKKPNKKRKKIKTVNELPSHPCSPLNRKQATKAKKDKTPKICNDNYSFDEVLSLLKKQTPATAAHISPVMTPKTPSFKRTNTPGDIERMRRTRSPIDNSFQLDSPLQAIQDAADYQLESENTDNEEPVVEMKTLSRSEHDDGCNKSFGAIHAVRNSLGGTGGVTPLSHSVCERDSIPVPKVLFPREDVCASQSGSTEYEVSTNAEDVANFETESLLGGNNFGISTLMKSFSTDVTKTMQAKRKHMESSAKKVAQKTSRLIQSAWSERRTHRWCALDSYKDKFHAELLSLETDIEKINQAENESMAYMSEQLKKIHTFNKTAAHKVKKFESLQTSLNKEALSWKTSDKATSHKTQQTLVKELGSFKSNILHEMQQQEIKNVRKTLQSMLAL